MVNACEGTQRVRLVDARPIAQPPVGDFVADGEQISLTRPISRALAG